MTVTAILVDDEYKSLAILKNKLERLCPNVTVIGETQDPEEALELILNSDKTALQKNTQLIENLGIQSFQQKKIVIPSQEGLEFVKIEDIIHCQGTDGYTKIHFQHSKPIVSSYSIGHFFKLLQHQDFYLIHKSHLININYILKYLNEGYVVLQDNHKLPVSRNKRADFLDMIRKV